MNYDNYTTFNVKIENVIARVTFGFPPVNIQGLPMLPTVWPVAISA